MAVRTRSTPARTTPTVARGAPLLGTLLALLLPLGASAGPLPASAGSLQLQVGFLPTLQIPGANAGQVSDLGPPDHSIREEPLAFGMQSFDVADSLFTGVPLVSDLRIGIGTGAAAETDPAGLGVPTATRTFEPGWTSLTNRVGGDFEGAFGGTAALVGTATVCVGGCANVAVQLPLSAVGAGGTLGRTALGEALFLRGGGGWTAGPARITFPSTTPGGTALRADGATTAVAGRPARGATLSHDAASNTAAATTAALELGPTFLATATPLTTTFTTLGVPVTTVLTTRTLTLSGTNRLQSSTGGTLQLVTPIRVDTGPQLAGSVGGFAVQRFLVPEPGTRALLGAGALALAATGRARMRSKRRAERGARSEPEASGGPS